VSNQARSFGSESPARDQMQLVSLAEGFIQSSVFFALLRLGVFEALGGDERTAAELAGSLGAQEAPLRRLLDAGVQIELLETSDDSRYGIPDRWQPFLLRSDAESYLGDWVLNLDYFRQALAGLDEAVRSGRPTVDADRHLGADPEETRGFTLAMHNYAAYRGAELAEFLDTGDVTTLLDLGCGPGTYAFSLGRANAALELYLLDLPGVLDVTREVAARYALPNPTTYLPLDALRDEIPGSYDLVLVSNTLHMLGEDASRELIARLYSSVNPGGSLVVQAQYLEEHRHGPRWPVYLDLIQLCITEHGRNHTVAETQGWLEAAGFEDVEYVPMTLLNTNSLVRGYRRS
jgi:SAM-dependent methyltransferase